MKIYIVEWYAHGWQKCHFGSAQDAELFAGALETKQEHHEAEGVHIKEIDFRLNNANLVASYLNQLA